MHKKLEADLTSLAHSILQMKNKEDVFALKDKAYAVYEKLAVLAYVEEYINNTPNPSQTKEEIIEKIEQAVEVVKNENVVEEVLEEKIDEVEEIEKVEESEEVETTEEILEKEIDKKTEADLEKPEVVDDVTDAPLEESEIKEEEKEEPVVHFLENDLFTEEKNKDDVKDVG